MTTKPIPPDAPTRKFLFERSFDPSAAVRVERKPVTLKPEQYDALKQESYDQGFTAGRQAGHDEQTAALMATIDRVGNVIEQMIHHFAALNKQSQDGMRRMALAMARKFVPELVAQQGTAEIEAMLNNVVAEMVHEPRLVVRVNEAQFDALNEKIKEIAEKKAYAGKIVVLADAEVAPGDCKAEWADGGIERNSEALWDKIEHTVSP
jgi:flagellar assembly protein FliH